MKKILLFVIVLVTAAMAQNYVGVENCQNCHTSGLRTYPGFANWKATNHAKIHELPTVSNMKGNYNDSVSMGSAYGNAKVSFRIDGANYFIKLIPVTGTPVEYQVVYTYGQAWKQRYLVKIGTSYYMPPVQWNLKKYEDNSTGNWVNYNPMNWFTSAGALKPIDNAFRTKSWDKNCAGCHVVPGDKSNTVTKVVTGTDTSYVYKNANNNSPANMVVGCESCHGHPTAFAGAGHVKKLTDLTYDRKLEVCGQCHFRGYSKNQTYEYPYNETANITYPVGDILANYIYMKPGVWPDQVSSLQHHQQWQDLKYSAHYNPNNGITCVTCHDPHQKTANPHQLKQDYNSMTAGIGCVSCHANKLTVVNGKNAHTKHSQAVSQCVNCHMTHNAKTARDYDISNHSFKIIRPSQTLVYSYTANGNINTCAVACHRNGLGTRGGGPSFGVTDANLTNWKEASDLALADTLWRHYQHLWPNYVPVELASFTAAEVKGAVVLKWSTASEKNNMGFMIERSSNKQNWVLVDRINGKGTKTTKTEYSYTDTKPGIGKVYFRLTQYDLDGTATVYGPVEVNVTSPFTFAVEQNYPNPFNPVTKIKFSIPSEGMVKISIYNSIGERIDQIVNEYKNAGAHEVSWNASGYPSGIYMYEVTAKSNADGKEFRTIKKMVLLK